jgi:hypothetical protein
MRATDRLAQAERIRRSADRLDRLERIGAHTVVQENERRILRRLLTELGEALAYGDDPRWFDQGRANVH